MKVSLHLHLEPERLVVHFALQFPRTYLKAQRIHPITINGYYKVPMIGFGPGNEVMAHAPNEKVPVDDLVKASAFYALYAYLIEKQ